jgi:hypothetical protein
MTFIEEELPVLRTARTSSRSGPQLVSRFESTIPQIHPDLVVLAKASLRD